MLEKSIEHFKKTSQIKQEEGLLKALDFNFQTLRDKNYFTNLVFAIIPGINYISQPDYIIPCKRDQTITYENKFYQTKYSRNNVLISLDFINK